MAVKISIVESYKHYGKCLKITNDLLEILITVDVGPRIIYFAVLLDGKYGQNSQLRTLVT